jgi:hypothetical protein
MMFKRSSGSRKILYMKLPMFPVEDMQKYYLRERYLFLLSSQVVDVSVLRCRTRIDYRAHAYHPSVFITHSKMRSLQNHPAKEFAFLTSSHLPTNPFLYSFPLTKTKGETKQQRIRPLCHGNFVAFTFQQSVLLPYNTVHIYPYDTIILYHQYTRP